MQRVNHRSKIMKLMKYRIRVPEDMIVGTIHNTNNNGLLKVVEYRGKLDVTVEFIETGTIKITTAGQIRSGNVKDDMLPNVCGVGFIGLGKHDYKHKSYKVWSNMLKRCYSTKFQERQPTYKGCTVEIDWHNFQNFAKWYDDNYKVYGEKKSQLDKDLLVVSNKVYSPDSCVFIPSWLNILTTDSGASRGTTMIGTYYYKVKGLYRALCSTGGKRKHLGYFKTEELAHEAWRDFKLDHVLSLKSEIDLIDERIYPNIVKMINNHSNLK